MVFDFSTTSGVIYVDNQLPDLPDYRLLLVSLYNNKGLENTVLGEINLTRLTGTSRYSVFSWDIAGSPLADIIDQDINGYYTASFEGGDRGAYTTLAQYPAKVKTLFTEAYPPQYESNNEDNEQYVYYRQ
jgi:hypothetical protein